MRGYRRRVVEIVRYKKQNISQQRYLEEKRPLRKVDPPGFQGDPPPPDTLTFD